MITVDAIMRKAVRVVAEAVIIRAKPCYRTFEEVRNPDKLVALVVSKVHRRPICVCHAGTVASIVVRIADLIVHPVYVPGLRRHPAPQVLPVLCLPENAIFKE